MTVISGVDYKGIADDYAAARNAVLDVREYLFDAVYKVVLLQSIMPGVDLLEVYWNSYLVNAPIYTNAINLVSAVKAMESHVLTRGGYANVDQYLAAEGIQVPAAWAELSDDAGYPISNTYIE